MRLKTLLSIQLATFIYTRATINQQQLCISQKLADKNQSSKVKWQQSAVNKSSDVRGRRRFFCLPTLNSWHCRPIFLDHVIGLKTWNRITVTQSYSSFILRKAAEAALKLWIPWNINWQHSDIAHLCQCQVHLTSCTLVASTKSDPRFKSGFPDCTQMYM